MTVMLAGRNVCLGPCACLIVVHPLAFDVFLRLLLFTLLTNELFLVYSMVVYFCDLTFSFLPSCVIVIGIHPLFRARIQGVTVGSQDPTYYAAISSPELCCNGMALVCHSNNRTSSKPQRSKGERKKEEREREEKNKLY